MFRTFGLAGRQGRMAALTLLLGTGFSALQGAHAATGDPVLIEQPVSAFLGRDGVWRSRGYGWIWQVRGGRVQMYDVTKTYCVKHAGVDDLPGDLKGPVKIDKNWRVAKLSIDDSLYSYTFDRVERLPSHCVEENGTSAKATLDAVIDIYSTHYAFFKERKVDWVQHVNQVRPKLRDGASNKQLYASITELIAPLDDAHVSITAEFDGEEFYFRPRGPRKPATEAELAKALETTGYWSRNIGEELLGQKAKVVGDGRIRYGFLDKDIGYLLVGSSGRTLRRALEGPIDDALTMFKDTKALIIDVSRNFGGTDVAAREFTRRFVDKRTLGYYRYAADDPRETPQAVYIEPSSRVRYTKPIFLITSRTSISAAELIVLVMRGLPHVTQIGGATRGSLSDVLQKRLPNGWRMNLSNEIYLDRDKKVWEGKGIPPDIEIPIANPEKLGPRNIEAAQKLLQFVRSRL